MHWIHKSVTQPLHINHSKSKYKNCSSEHNSIYNVDKNPNKVLLSIPQNTTSKLRIEDDIIQYANSILHEPTFVITQADIHNEQTQVKRKINFDLLPPYPENTISHSRQHSEEFPPPPYPIISLASHSHEGSEDFPPPPSPIENNNQIQPNESINSKQSQAQIQTPQKCEIQQITSLLGQLKIKKEQILVSGKAEKTMKFQVHENERTLNEKWLRELKANKTQNWTNKSETANQNISQKKPILMPQDINTNIVKRTSDLKMNSKVTTSVGRDVSDYPRIIHSSVKDIAAKFERQTENVQLQRRIFLNSPVTITRDYSSSEDYKSVDILKDNIFITNKLKNDHTGKVTNSFVESTLSKTCDTSYVINNIPTGNKSELNAAILSMSLTLPHENGLPIDLPENDISEVAMQNTLQNVTILPNEDDILSRKVQKGICKKKSVSFCDQVVLVATAEDDEKDSYIPNPILERVLRSAMNKPETAQLLQEIRTLQKAELNRDVNIPIKFEQITLPLKTEIGSKPATLYQNQLKSMNLSEQNQSNLGRPNVSESVNLENKNLNSVYEKDNEDIVNETFPITSNISSRQTSTFSQSQQLFYTQSNYLQSHQLNLAQNPQVVTSYSRNQNIPQHQTSTSTCLIPLQREYIQNNFYSKSNCLKTTYQQQNNQTNRPLFTQQQQNIVHPNMQGQNDSSINIQQNIYQKQQSQGEHLITINSQQSQQQEPFIVNGQSTNLYPEYSYQGNPNQIVPQQRINQHLTYYQFIPNSINNYQHSIQQIQPQQQCLQNGTAIACQQKVENFRRQSKKIEQQIVHLHSQVYSNAQAIPSNIKYPMYQHFQQTKQIKSIHQQIHKLHNNIKGSSNININPLIGQKLLNDASKSIPCHLCRKKQVLEPVIYCSDCDFYMSRFRPKN
jgi:hypothetical protein